MIPTLQQPARSRARVCAVRVCEPAAPVRALWWLPGVTVVTTPQAPLETEYLHAEVYYERMQRYNEED